MSNPFMPGNNSLLNAFLNANRKPRFEIYEDHKEPEKKWRWRIMMSSDIIGASTQGYSSKALCLSNVKNLGNYIKELESDGKII